MIDSLSHLLPVTTMEGVREDLISQGLKFLHSNQDIASSPLSSKISFLETKGLTPSEINETLMRLTNFQRKNSGGSGTMLNWILNYIVTPLAIIGTGFLVYNLTGGEEEFPKPIDAQDPNTVQQIPSSNDLQDISAATSYRPPLDDNLHDSYDSRSLVHVHEEQPEWAKELSRLSAALSEDVKIIKSKLDDLIAEKNKREADKDGEQMQLQKNSPDDVAVSRAPISIESRFTVLFDAIREFKEAAKSTSNEDAMKKCCGSLIMYIKMLVEQPDVPRYRRISVTNDSFKSSVQSVQGHDKVLESVGFVRRGLYYEWTWAATGSGSDQDAIPDSPSRALLLGTCLSSLEKLKLHGVDAQIDETSNIAVNTPDDASASVVGNPGEPIVESSPTTSTTFTFEDIFQKVKSKQEL